MRLQISLPLLAGGLMALTGCGAHGGTVPAQHASAYAPEAIRTAMTGRVYVRETQSGASNPGLVSVRYLRPDGSNLNCILRGRYKGKDLRGRSGKAFWRVRADRRGRAVIEQWARTPNGRANIPEYDPRTGDFDYSRWSGGRLRPISKGWLQNRWPRAAADLCPNVKTGLGIEEHQTGTTLAELRAQAPDAPLKNLARPLPKAGAPAPAGKRSAAPASRALAKAPPLTEKDRAGLLAMGVPERYLPAFEDQLVTPAGWARLLEKGFTPARVAEIAALDTATRARNAGLQVVSAGDGVARLRSWLGHWDVREGERVSTIGRVSRITPGGAVWLQGMAEPLPGAAR